MATLQIEDLTTRTITIVEVVTKTLLVSEGGGGGGGGGSGGGVVSVGLEMPSVFNVDGSPITDTGVFKVTWGTQTKALFLATPTANDGAPTFRVIAAGDLPSELNITNLNPTAATGGSAVISIGKDNLYLRADEGVDVEGFLGASSLGGDGSKITNINADNIDSGTLDSTQLPTTGVTDGSYGSATASFVAAVDKYGRITTAESKTITPSWGNLVSVPANVDAFGNLVSVADSLGYFTGSGTMKVTTFTTQARNLLDDTTEGEMQITIGGTTIGRAFFTAANPSAVTFPRANADNTVSLLSASDYRTAIGTKIGSDVQAYHANLAALAGLTGEADRGVYFTGAGALALFTQTSFARQLADDADAATARGTLGVNNPIVSIDLPNGTHRILQYATVAFTINTAFAAQASAGSGTLTVAINGTPVTGLNAAAVTTTPADLTATAANTVGVGNYVEVTVAGLAANETIAATIQGTRT